MTGTRKIALLVVVNAKDRKKSYLVHAYENTLLQVVGLGPMTICQILSRAVRGERSKNAGVSNSTSWFLLTGDMGGYVITAAPEPIYYSR